MEAFKDPVIIPRLGAFDVWCKPTQAPDASNEDIHGVHIATCPKKDVALGLVRAINKMNEGAR